MSACAMMYASTGEKALLDKLNYMLDELQECKNRPRMVGSLPVKEERRVILQLLQGNVVLNQPDETGQPWNYNQNGTHGIVSIRFWGLRDAYVYAGCSANQGYMMPLDFISHSLE